MPGRTRSSVFRIASWCTLSTRHDSRTCLRQRRREWRDMNQGADFFSWSELSWFDGRTPPAFTSTSATGNLMALGGWRLMVPGGVDSAISRPGIMGVVGRQEGLGGKMQKALARS